ncbi:MAG TPA: ferritin family protein [Burkholderiales bacterium]|nr:ferritin family protein [Burkholderiales bacterium]
MTAGKKKKGPDAAFADFMARAYVMEIDASERYADFADQMEVHNNLEVAQLFRKLSRIEGLHAKRILQEMGWKRPPENLLAWRWDDAEPPETAPVTDLHYLMQPWHALEIALRNERRAEKFFARIVRSAKTPAAVKKIAAEMAEEEHEHVRLIRDWMKRVPKPVPGWDRDPDPPVYSD